MNIGKMIKILRTMEGLDQGTLANRMSVTRTYLSQIENSKKAPSLSFLRKFSEEFNIPLSLLFIGEDDRGNINSEILSKLQELLNKVLILKASQYAETETS